MPCKLRQAPFTIDLVGSDVLQKGHDVLEGIFVRQTIFRDGSDDGIEHLQRKVVDKKPCFEGILVAHIAGRCVKRIVIALE